MQLAMDDEQHNCIGASGLRDKAEWARYAANEIKRRGTARIKEMTQAHGEAVSPSMNKYLYDTLTVPDLAAVEASLGRSRLLLEVGPDMAAMGLDAADTIQASNSLEKMLAHQLAALHKIAMQLFSNTCSDDVAYRMKRLKAGTECMRAYQDGLMTLDKIRKGRNQCIKVQYVNVTNGAQAVIGNVKRSSS